jgi:hypothetical protein
MASNSLEQFQTILNHFQTIGIGFGLGLRKVPRTKLFGFQFGQKLLKPNQTLATLGPAI